MGRPEIPQYFTPPAFLISRLPTCIWPPTVVWYSYLRRFCLACIIEVSVLAQLPALTAISRVWRSDFLYSFPLFHPKLSSVFQHDCGGREISGQAAREALFPKVNVLASAFAARAVTMLCAWPALAQRTSTFCEAAWHCDAQCSKLGFLPVAAGVWPWVTSVSEPRGQHIQQSLRFVKLRNTPLAHVRPGLQCLWLLPGL